MTKDHLKKIIGNNIRTARVARGMSIDELAELLGLTSGFVGLIERGSRGATVYTLFKLADIMETSIDSFFYGNASGTELKLAESKRSKGNVKKEKISSLMVDFSDSELDFIVGVVKNLRNLNHTVVLRKDTDDEED